MKRIELRNSRLQFYLTPQCSSYCVWPGEQARKRLCCRQVACCSLLGLARHGYVDVCLHLSLSSLLSSDH